MDGDPHCGRCGVALTGQAVGELCANCLLKLALEPLNVATHHERRQSSADSGHTAIIGPLTEVPGTVIGHYKLREELGEGGFGVVCVAEQEEAVRRRVTAVACILGSLIITLAFTWIAACDLHVLEVTVL